MGSGGVAQRANPRRIDAELNGVRAEPSNGELRINQLRWPSIMFAGVGEPIVDGDRHEALIRGGLAELVIRALVTLDPIAAMDHNHRRPPLGVLGRRQAKIEVLRQIWTVGNIETHL